MWILTQNGKRILSTEGLDEIAVADPAEGKTDFAVMLRRRADGKPFALGFYAKKEMAADVLKEIFKVQSEFYSLKNVADDGVKLTNIIVPPKVYEMPPDKDMAFAREIAVRKGASHDGKD